MCMAGIRSRKDKNWGEQSGSHWPLTIHLLNMKIYYTIMCSVCKLEGNHMKKFQTKSLLCSSWPPPTPIFRLLQVRERERNIHRARESREVKGGGVCSHRSWKEKHTPLAASHCQTHWSTGEQHDQRALNPGILSVAVKPWLLQTKVTCCLAYLSERGKMQSLLGEARGGEGMIKGNAMNWGGREGKLWKSLSE